jgi:hypothetical protein
MMSRYVPPLVSAEEAEQLRAKLVAYEDELCRAYALLWYKQAALDEADCSVSKLMTALQAQQRELEALRSASDNTN